MTTTPSPNPAEAQERERAEQMYTITAQDYATAPVGSRDWILFWSGWRHARASHAPAAASGEAVYLVATGEVHEGSETYTRHDTPPPMCDFEKLFAKANPAAGAEPVRFGAGAKRFTVCANPRTDIRAEAEQWVANWKLNYGDEVTAWMIEAALDDFAHKVDGGLRASIRLMASSLARKEWAEHCGGDHDAIALECEITKLIGSIAAPPATSERDAHPDDLAVDAFASAMKAKLATQRAKGYGGWETCPVEHLQSLLFSHIPKGDPVDVANFAMMLSARGERTAYEDQWVYDLTGKWPSTSESDAEDADWDFQPQITSAEHGKEPSLRTVLKHYYVSNGIDNLTADELVGQYIDAQREQSEKRSGEEGK